MSTIVDNNQQLPLNTPPLVGANSNNNYHGSSSNSISGADNSNRQQQSNNDSGNKSQADIKMSTFQTQSQSSTPLNQSNSNNNLTQQQQPIKHVHYDHNPKIFFLPTSKDGKKQFQLQQLQQQQQQTKIIYHDFTNTLTSILKAIAIPLIVIFIILLIPIGNIGRGFLLNWVYTLIYIPCVAISTSIFHIGWAKIFIKGYRHFSPLFLYTVLVTLTFALISQFVRGTPRFPLPIQIVLVPVESMIILPILVYLRSSDRFKTTYNSVFIKYLIFLLLVTVTILVSIAFVILFSFKRFQLIVGIVYFIFIFVLNHGLLHLTQKNTPRSNHNIICYWVETISELVFCFMFIRISQLNFFILLCIKLLALIRYPFFLSDRYWKWRCDTLQNWGQLNDNNSNGTNIHQQHHSTSTFDKIYQSLVGLVLPISVEKEEHQTRVVDRFFFTCLAYVGVPLFYILFTVCIRMGHTSKYYPYAPLELPQYLQYVIFSFFSSFFSFITFILIRWVFQSKFSISVLNHPIQSLKNNVDQFMFCNFNALLLPITFMMSHNMVYYLVNKPI